VVEEPNLIDTSMVENDHSNQIELDPNIYNFNNIILVADISTSMKYNNKVNYLNSSVNQLIEALRRKDQVGMISLASTANIIHAPGYVTNKDSLRSILTTIKIGGATNGGAALQMAYKMASEHFVLEGNNQIIIATDGTFTGGNMSRKEMLELIQLKTEEGVHLSTIGLNPNERGILFLNKLAEIGLGDYIQINGKEGEESKLLEMVKIQSKKTP
jgi:Ca-activated chloride channel family protein